MISKFCFFCKESFFNESKYFNRQKYCSKNCKNKASDKRRSKNQNRIDCRRKIDLKYRNKNLQARRLNYTKWSKTEKGKILRRVSTSTRNKRIKLQTPKWADIDAIKKIYLKCKLMNLEQNIYQVDHIYPLNGENICGLHIAENLQIITAKENFSKGNKMPYEKD